MLICVETLSWHTSFHNFLFSKKPPLENFELWYCVKKKVFSPPFSGCWLALREIISLSSSLWVHFCFPQTNHELPWKILILRGFDFVFGWLWDWVDASLVWLLWDWRKFPHLDLKLTPFSFLLQRVITLGLIGKGSFILFYA